MLPAIYRTDTFLFPQSQQFHKHRYRAWNLLETWGPCKLRFPSHWQNWAARTLNWLLKRLTVPRMDEAAGEDKTQGLLALLALEAIFTSKFWPRFRRLVFLVAASTRAQELLLGS